MWEYRLLYAQLGQVDRPQPSRHDATPPRAPSRRRVYNLEYKGRIRLAGAR
jgi:hypothetical protein